MTERIHAKEVGAPNPELKTSPIVEDTDEFFEFAGQHIPDTPVCYFNDKVFPEGDYICSGSELLRCVKGVWLCEGSCDQDNP